MKQLLILLSILAFTLAAPVPATVHGTIHDVTAKRATSDLADLVPGMSGIVVHAYDDTHRAIVASAVVVSSSADGSQLKLSTFKGLRQPRLPEIKTKPADGDTVILGYLYDRVLPIVPNQASFEKAKNALNDLTLIHPDLFAARLAEEKNPRPTKSSIQKMCRQMHLGLVLFMFDNGSDFIDCTSWKRVAHTDLKADNPKKFKQPFYHRFDSIPGGFFDWSDYTIHDYDAYYRKLEKK